MKLYLKDIYPTQFVYEYVPKIIVGYFLEKMNKNKKEIETFLKTNFKITINQLANLIYKSLSIRKFGNLYIISIGNNYIDNIVRTLDYGNSDFKGLNLFDSSIRRIQQNIYSFYLRYTYMK